MFISWSLSGMLKGVEATFDIETLIGKPIYLDNYKAVGYITNVFPETDLVYGEVPDKEYDKLILDSKGTAMCSFEIAKEER